jgi:2-succinyl-6-hydroxy-2,4-cyclohexadiene-1-carboxylate synthase
MMTSTKASDLTLTSGILRRGNEELYYEYAGSGDAVVLCHGGGGNHGIWYQQVPILARHYQVFTWDQRGFGRSTNVSLDAGPEVASDDLVALLDHWQIERAHLVGQSIGGWATLGCALRWPERVVSMLLSSTIAGIFTDRTAAAFDAFMAGPAGPRPSGPIPLGRTFALSERFSTQHPVQTFLYQQLGSIAAPMPHDAIDRIRACAYPLDDVAELTHPALFMVGSDDPVFPPDAVSEAAAVLPGAHVIELAGGGHSLYFERASEWNRIALEFMAASAVT